LRWRWWRPAPNIPPRRAAALLAHRIHCGPATAGIIGDTRFSYDVWGEAVNIAARLEQQGEAGSVHVSAAFRAATGALSFEERGPVDLKGVGEMRTFFLVDGPDDSWTDVADVDPA
jgi:adenylate cyclase